MNAAWRCVGIRGARSARAARPARGEGADRGTRASGAPIYTAALYAGLVHGGLQGLRWQGVDIERGMTRVERGSDPRMT